MSLIRGSGGVSSSDIPTRTVIVKSAEQLSGQLRSDIEYFLDGVIDFTGTGLSIEVPQGGLSLRGYGFDISGLRCSDDNYTMFTSPIGGSGNVLGADYFIEVSGAASKVYDLVSDTGFEAFEFTRINYNNCTSLGVIDNYRQGLEDGTGRFGGSPSLELKGVWVGGYRITTSIVRSLPGTVTAPLFKAGAGFSMQSRFLTDINVDLPTLAPLIDFAPSNFPNPSTLQISGAIVTRDGSFDANDPNITPNVTAGDLCSSWKGNNGLPNTFEGGSIGVTAQVATANSVVAVGAFIDVDATTWTTTGLQHFDNPADGQLRHLGNSPREFKVLVSATAESTANDVVVIRVLKWDNSASSFVTVLDQIRQVNSLVGGRDVAFYNININTTLDQNDYIKLQVANQTAANDVTIENDSYMIIEER